MRKHLLAAASAAALTLSTAAFAQSTDAGGTTVLPAPTVGNDQAGQTSNSGSSVRNGAQTGPADENQAGATTEDTQGGGGTGVTPEIANDRGQTQPSGSSDVNSTTGAVTATQKEGGVGVTPDISNSRGQTQASGSSRVNSTTGAVNPGGCGDTGMTQSNQGQTTANC